MQRKWFFPRFMCRFFTNLIWFYRQGLYPGKHGVLANDVYDMEQGLLKYSYELFHYSNETVPIWVSNACRIYLLVFEIVVFVLYLFNRLQIKWLVSIQDACGLVLTTPTTYSGKTYPVHSQGVSIQNLNLWNVSIRSWAGSNIQRHQSIWDCYTLKNQTCKHTCTGQTVIRWLLYQLWITISWRYHSLLYCPQFDHLVRFYCCDVIYWFIANRLIDCAMYFIVLFS